MVPFASLILLVSLVLTEEGEGIATSQPAERESAPCVNFLGMPAGPINEPCISDRPDFTESPNAVPHGRVQIEGGYTFSYDKEHDVRIRDHTLPEILMRVGVVEDVELRIGWAGGSFTDTFTHERNERGRTEVIKTHDDGATDMIIGGKYHFAQQKGLRPEMGIIAEMSVPTGAQSKTSDDVDPQVKWLWAYGLTDSLSLSGNVNLAVPTSEGDRFFQTATSVSLGWQITEHLGSYIEYFGFYPNDRGSDCAHSINGGFTIPITCNLQFDVRCGAGLNEEADDFFAGTGFVFRF